MIKAKAGCSPSDSTKEQWPERNGAWPPLGSFSH